ncbi:MAG TPA: hypothetical protein PKY56_01645 [Candidatus Kapabacteria bacterium]|nr:hypothetical protein [Candidatus Kapabacteria bacterium]HPO62431.1 hypothetical protein [Candidatus Kapabacteria bacterium]
MKKFITVFILLIAILSLSYYNYQKYDYNYFKNIRNGKEYINGGLKVLEIYNKNSLLAANTFDTLIILNYRCFVENGNRISVGDNLGIKATIVNPDTVSAYFVHIQTPRFWKVIISLIPFFIIIYFFFKYFKFDFKKFIFIRKNA